MMFGSRPPLNAREQAWTEYRVHWIAKQFGEPRLRDVVMVTPACSRLTSMFIDDTVELDALRELMCDHLDLMDHRLRIELDDEALCGSSQAEWRVRGDSTVISVGHAACQSPLQLISAVAQACADLTLERCDWPQQGVTDRRFLAELLASQAGFGLFCANADAVSCQDSTVSFWWSQQQGSLLSARIHGYALALCAWLHEDPARDWARHLRLDVRDAFKKSLRYLKKQRGSKQDMVAVYDRSASLALDDLNSRDLSQRIHALWALRQTDRSQIDVTRLLPLLDERDATIRGEAALTLGCVAGGDDQTCETLVRVLQGSDLTRVERVCMVAALGMCGTSMPEVVEALSGQLEHSRMDVAVTAALSLGQVGLAAASAIPQLLQLLARAVIQCRHDAVDLTLHALQRISSNVHELLQTGIADTEIREAAIQAGRAAGFDADGGPLPRLFHPLPLI